MAGQMIMQGFVGFRIPVWVRRLVTMIPAFVVVALGVNATKRLVISQVVLSIALPVPMIALVLFTRRADIMGSFANGRGTDAAAIAGAAIILALNVILLLQVAALIFPACLRTSRCSRAVSKSSCLFFRSVLIYPLELFLCSL